MKSIETRLAVLESAIEQMSAEETVVPVRIIIATTREELLALDRLREALPPADRPQPRGRIRLEMLPSIDARTCLREHGIELPAETENQEEQKT